ncbi:MAG: DEAD/DEAH box helicase family protein [Synergistaceae bacterium]|nr:DEAD/DEAH box helicase family protein [Synergistaceae bacterium]
MQLKNFQRDALDNLDKFLQIITNEPKLELWDAYKKFCDESSDPYIKIKGKKFYHDDIEGVPRVCFQVPTGGGKTLMAAASLNIICSYLRPNINKLIVWLVPSETILTQTYKNLSDRHHAYRQRLDEDFGIVEVYNKTQLLNAENFSPQSVEENLSVLILSYDSFRKKSKEYYKAFQENGNLLKFENAIKDDEVLPGANEFSLIQVIRHYRPIVIVDESHHTKTPLSKEMLENFRPSFILELTATPRNANIIAYANPAKLKAAQMVKLPVQVVNFKDKKDVISGAIAKREALESLAGGVIRPIVLFQAESKGKTEDRATFDKVKQDLIKNYNISPDQIAIKTAEINELKNINLNDKACKIKYVITINALAEGWDCPSAYILASLANRNSPVEVEQLLGRILRQPNTKNFDKDELNKSYVFTSSENFRKTVDNIVMALNNEGYDASACSAVDENNQSVSPDGQGELNFEDNNKADNKADDDIVKIIKIKERFAAEPIILPQFVININDEEQGKAFDDDELNILKLDKKLLCSDFDLTVQDADVNFNMPVQRAVELDVDSSDDSLIRKTVSDRELEFTIKKFDELKTFQDKRAEFIKKLTASLDRKYNELARAEIASYVERAVKKISDKGLRSAYINNIYYADEIKSKIDGLMQEHAMKIFYDYASIKKIFTRPLYKFPDAIEIVKPINFGNTLYVSEEDDYKSVNNLEYNMAMQLSSLENILWWHRNPASASNGGFYLNGFINHYPDFIARTKNNITLLIETKGDHLDNADSKLKSDLGEKWESMAGNNFKYFMVFDNNNNLDHTLNFQDFMNKVKYL